MPTRIAILGSNSFAASAFAAHALDLGHDVLGISRSPEAAPVFLSCPAHQRAHALRFVQADLRSEFERVCSALEEFSPEHVVDFAGQGMVAESWHAPDQWYATNIVAKVRLHDFLRRQSGLNKYVRISTPEVYGSHHQPVTEDHPYSPSTPYAISHAAIDMSLRAFYRNYGFPVVLGRFANFYGPRQQLYRIIPRTIICARSDHKLRLDGGGTSLRSFIHVQDAARAIMAMLDAGKPGEIYHFSPAQVLSIRELVVKLCALMNVTFSDLVETAAERPGKDHAYLMDSGKSRQDLDWHERIGLEAGLTQTIDWVEANWDTLRNLPHHYIHRP
jgi:dTDP-glucose 4,6-dehydratase